MDLSSLCCWAPANKFFKMSKLSLQWQCMCDNAVTDGYLSQAELKPWKQFCLWKQ